MFVFTLLFIGISGFPGPTSQASSDNLLEMQIFGPHLKRLNQNSAANIKQICVLASHAGGSAAC